MNIVITSVGAVFLAFLAGSLPFSPWLARIAGKDITGIGDGNPGAFNVFRTGRRFLGVLALLLDFFKGFLPVFLFLQLLRPEGLFLVCLGTAPVLGHAFMPWRGFRGGKGVNVTFGVWTALTLWVVPVFLGSVLTLLVLAFRKALPDAWKVLLGMILAVPGALLWIGAPPEFWGIFGVNVLVLAWTHRQELRRGGEREKGREGSS